MHHGRHAFLSFEETLGPGARFRVQVPVKTFGQIHILRGLQSETVYVGQEHQQSGQRLLGHDAELGCLLNGVGGIGAGVGQPDYFGAGSLRLEQEGREISPRERMAHRTQHFATVGLHYRAGVPLQGMPERIVSCQEKPAVATLLHYRLAGTVGKRVGIVNIMHIGIGAVFAGNQRGSRARHDGDAVLFFGNGHHRQRGRGGDQITDHVHVVALEPFARLVRRDIALVLMVCRYQLDFEGRLFARLKIFDRHACRHDRAGA